MPVPTARRSCWKNLARVSTVEQAVDLRLAVFGLPDVAHLPQAEPLIQQVVDLRLAAFGLLDVVLPQAEPLVQQVRLR